MSRTGEEDNETSLANISTEAAMDKLKTCIIERILARRIIEVRPDYYQGRREQQDKGLEQGTRYYSWHEVTLVGVGGLAVSNTVWRVQ